MPRLGHAILRFVMPSLAARLHPESVAVDGNEMKVIAFSPDEEDQ